jgi:hypothetical protein
VVVLGAFQVFMAITSEYDPITSKPFYEKGDSGCLMWKFCWVTGAFVPKLQCSVYVYVFQSVLPRGY